jgi:hypothetical protein
VLPVAAAVLWGAFAAPKARWPSSRGRLAVELLVFGGAAAALAAAGHPALGLAFAAVAVVDGALVRLPFVSELAAPGR